MKSKFLQFFSTIAGFFKGDYSIERKNTIFENDVVPGSYKKKRSGGKKSNKWTAKFNARIRARRLYNYYMDGNPVTRQGLEFLSDMGLIKWSNKRHEIQ